MDWSPSRITLNINVENNSYYEKIGENVRCIDEEIPFDVPDSWVWCRLGNIGNWGAGATPLRTNKDYYIDGNILWLKTGELNNSYIYDTEEKITKKALHECSLKINRIGDVLIAMYGATIGKLAIVGCELTTNQACCGCTPFNGINNLFLFYFLQASKTALISQGEGGAQPNISREKIVKFLIALPSETEQNKIVQQIQIIDDFIQKYDKLEQQEFQLETNFPDNLKKSILQSAIQGKLVAQNPNDEPASVLLDKIRKEKEQFIKAGKLKHNKTESFIYRDTADNSYYEKIGGEVRCIDEEIPFEVPKSWAWARLGSICNFGKTTNIDSQNITEKTWVLDLEDIEKDSGILLVKKRKKDIKVLSTKHLFKEGNVLYSKLRPYLNKVIIADENGCCTSEILPLDFSIIYNKYAQIVLMSPYFVGYTIQCSYGVKMPRLGTVDGQNALFPVPPLSEQRKIVEKAITIFNVFKLL
ncbi:MAG: restriction endonuclease subunit S [Tannerella sp.]|jgi:type I restriction enzyme S subunit|nr:restriction endonuclease subunit S [Tannerella sp.]